MVICGLPPLNGFVSEFLVYYGAFSSIAAPAGAAVPILLSIIAGLALIGGLAAACFAKAFGIIFLGESRSERALQAHEADVGMIVPQYILAAGCAAIGLLSPWLIELLIPAVAVVTGPIAAEVIAPAFAVLKGVTISCLGLLALLALLAMLRWRLLHKREVVTNVTWDCGYAAPTARMQYTASSFAQPLTDFSGYFFGRASSQ